jgi:general stress protein 26
LERAMSKLTLSDVAEKMRGIDIAFLSTKSDSGEIASRPMSNNGNVEYDGDSYYFTLDSTQTVTDITRDAKVSLAFSGKPGLLSSAAKFYAAIEGDAEVIRDKAAFEEHWASDLDAWFKQGVDTPGLVLIKVSARRIKYWNGYDEGELDV